MSETQHYLCLECIKDKYLKNYVLIRYDSIETCSICQNKSRGININNQNLNDFCRFLIRYHYPEYEYNSHFGGDNLPSQFYKENPIISHLYNDNDARLEEIEDFLFLLFDLHNDNSEIDLYYGHYNGERFLWPNAIKNEKSKIWEQYTKELQEVNYYELEEHAKETFEKILDGLRHTLAIDMVFHRARIGYEIKKESTNLGTNTIDIKIPFKGQQISSPPILRANPGRANRQGVSFLYLASTEETALGEVRPHPGHYVSVSKFNSIVKLHVADLRLIDLEKYYKSEDLLESFKLLRDLSDELSIPILPEEKQNYIVTQFITDIVRQLGFDAILYNSSVTNGYNVVAFDPRKFSNESQDSTLIKISSVSFTYKQIEYEIDNWMKNLTEK